MPIKAVDANINQYAKALKKAYLKNPDAIAEARYFNDPIFNKDGKISKKAIKKLLISQDTFTKSGKLNENGKSKISNCILFESTDKFTSASDASLKKVAQGIVDHTILHNYFFI